MPEKVQCPNCLGEAEKTGDKIMCVRCDATFKITRTGAAVVAKIGQVEALEARVKNIEDRISGRAELDPGPEETKPEKEEDIL